MKTIRNEGVFRLFDRSTTLILTDEKQLERIVEHPNLPLFDDEERGFSLEKKGLYPPGTTLDSFMQDAKEKGITRIEVSYDFFFGGSKRENYPDSPLTKKAYKVIHDYAAKYGMTFGASLISPLDLGGGYVKSHTDRGYSWQMEEGAIKDGAYSVPMRRQLQWYNNKGPIQLKVNRIMAYAFDEKVSANGRGFVVDVNAMEDISDTCVLQADGEGYTITESGYACDEMTVSGSTGTDKARVLIIVEYATPEQDYFAPDAFDYAKGILDDYKKDGVSFHGFYSDEMHIQFDWDLNEHFGPTEIKTRYVTDSLIEEYARLYGDEYSDFARYMILFAYTKHEDGAFHSHMMEDGADGVYKTVLFRKRYFEMLFGRVVGLSLKTKEYAEQLAGGPVMTRAHSTWQESPTCDHFSEDYAFSVRNRREVCRYDYDKPYVWSSTIRENISACGDYFRWNEFLSGAGTDHPEGGNTDRNYYAQAFACSLGALNPFEHAYCASWGSPEPVKDRFTAVGNTYGTNEIDHALVHNMRHRLSDVLILYPTELNYAEERFGTWMVQYGYADYITEEKLLIHAKPSDDGFLHIKDRKYRAVVALFEPFVDQATYSLLKRFVLSGGRLLWTGPAALRFEDGASAEQEFLEAMGLKRASSIGEGVQKEDAQVKFCGRFKDIADMTIRTGLLPDHVYPIEAGDAEVIAEIDGVPVGAYAKRGLGEVCYLGFRPRDDQSRSIGHEDVSTLFDVLMTLGAYAPDSLEAKSRPADSRYIANVFENGSISIANHYRTFEEDWYGSFFRDEEEDKRLLEGRTLPPFALELKDEAFLGHTVTYDGEGCVTFRLNEKGELTGFAGSNADSITIDGRTHTFFTERAEVLFNEMEASRTEAGIKKLLIIRCDRPGTITLPLPEGFIEPKAGVCRFGFTETDREIPCTVENGVLTVPITEEEKNLFIAVYQMN
ncbi:MAG: hypothetical protein IJE08_11930 [Clostridia bacterium]|nr:hypothetical protein [Clostridia bacterium]